MSCMRILGLLLLVSCGAAIAQHDWDNWTTHQRPNGCQISAGIILEHPEGETRFLISFWFVGDRTNASTLIEAYDETLLPDSPAVIQASDVSFEASPSKQYPHSYQLTSAETISLIQSLRHSENLEVHVKLRSGRALHLETVSKHLLEHIDQLGECSGQDT